ncbi:MAG: DUF1080 domain-containing protein [Planctomycetia bacterium]|nr:DUF1080 domain-containing protein [Planctomycetia bacterium]
MRYKLTMLLLCVLLISGSQSLAADGFVPLFDGKTLDGWTPLPGGTWEVADGAIVGSQDSSEKRHGMLLSQKQYGDFIVRLKYKSLEGNSGFYFRVQKVDHAVSVKGFQAEIDADGKDVGGLYETLGRAWVVQPKPEDIKTYYKDKDWNEMTVSAIGGDVTVTVNGVKTAVLKDDPSPREGYFGMQLHGGQNMHVLFKDVEIKELSGSVQPVIAEKIHDTSRPLPEIVQPKSLESLSDSRQPPQNAIVLFDGTNLDHWQGGSWQIKDGSLETTAGDLMTKQSFGDCQLHVEWRVPDPDSHGNSGIYLMNLYEVQIFNSHNNRAAIYADGQAAAVYGQYPPLVNACREPGQWEVFDITFHGPRFDEAGKLTRPATVSLLHNGILAQDRVALTGPTFHKQRPPYAKHAESLPFYLQHHGDRLQFRNIWIVPL